MNIKRKLIVRWAKFQKFPYCRRGSRENFRSIQQGLIRNRKLVERIMSILESDPHTKHVNRSTL